MTDTPLHVDPAALHAAGIRCTTAAHDIENALAATDAVVRGSGSGFSTSSTPALGALSDRLDARRRELIATMTRLGESLHQAAQAYQSTETASARSIDSSGSGLNLEP